MDRTVHAPRGLVAACAGALAAIGLLAVATPGAGAARSVVGGRPAASSLRLPHPPSVRSAPAPNPDRRSPLQGPDPARLDGPGLRDSGPAGRIATANWSGVIDTGTTYSGARGSWVVPTVRPATTFAVVSTWVGVGGDNPSTLLHDGLIQTGTTQATTSGATVYFAWYEMLPTSSVPLTEPVDPGDHLQASVLQNSPGTWEIQIENVTQGWMFTHAFKYAPATSSAEWIAEAPTTGGNTEILPLADYGSVRFSTLATQPADPAAVTVTLCYLNDPTRGNRIVSYPNDVGPTAFTATYGSPLPTVSSIAPDRGTVSGGTTVTITGTYLVPTLVRTIRFGSQPATFVGIARDGTVTVTSPAGTGTVDVTVTTTDGTSAVTPADRFTYLGGPVTPPPPPTPTSSGYDLVGSDGGVFVFPTGSSGGFYGSLPGLGVQVNDIVGMVPTADDQGYFLVGSDGGVFAFGNAPFLGSLPGLGVKPAQPITGIVPTGTDGGYFLVGRDGGVYAFGNAPFLGSLPGDGVSVDNVIGITATPSGNGYWLVSSTGTVYAFGGARHLGTAKGSPSPVSAIAGTPTGGGYWIVTENGTVYPFGSAKGFGTLPALGVPPAKPVIGVVHTQGTAGYWLIGSDGGIFAFGDAPFVGSLPGLGVGVTDIVGAVPTGG
jgi:hypothetical protein